MFSFIIPAYNEEKYIGACLKSIIELDDFGDSEIIVVDNGSNDNTAKIVIDNFPKIKLISETRRGTGWAREAGFRSSAGELLAFIDADCILPKSWITVVNGIVSMHSDGAAFSGPYDYNFKGLTNFLANIYCWFLELFSTKIFNFFGTGGILIAGNMLIRRSALEKIGGFDTNIIFWGDDTLLAKHLRKVGPIYFLNAMKLYSSPRRLLEGGIIRITLLYFINALWVFLFNKPLNKTYKAIR